MHGHPSWMGCPWLSLLKKNPRCRSVSIQRTEGNAAKGKTSKINYASNRSAHCSWLLKRCTSWTMLILRSLTAQTAQHDKPIRISTKYGHFPANRYFFSFLISLQMADYIVRSCCCRFTRCTYVGYGAPSWFCEDRSKRSSSLVADLVTYCITSLYPRPLY